MFPREQFQKRGIRYEISAKVKSDLYVDFLPLLNSGSVMLPRSDRLVAQLASLERTSARGTGKDSIDHPRDQHDDLANVVAGAATLARSHGGYLQALARACRDDDAPDEPTWADKEAPPRRIDAAMSAGPRLLDAALIRRCREQGGAGGMRRTHTRPQATEVLRAESALPPASGPSSCPRSTASSPACAVSAPRTLGIGEAGIDLLVELVDDFSGRVLGCADAIPNTCLVTRHGIPAMDGIPAARPSELRS